MKIMKVRLTFTEEALGTANPDPKTHGEYIASNAPNMTLTEEEIDATIEGEEGKDAIENRMTVFSREDGNPIMWDYQIKGFFKDACGVLRRVSSTESAKIKAFKKEIDGLIFVGPRKIPVIMSGDIGDCPRPLRASTAQGERVALANSETVPVGSFLEFEIKMLLDSHEKAVREWLDYGEYRGLGQWRNSGKGRFTWEEISA